MIRDWRQPPDDLSRDGKENGKGMEMKSANKGRSESAGARLGRRAAAGRGHQVKKLFYLKKLKEQPGEKRPARHRAGAI